MKKFFEMKPAFTTSVSITDDGYLVLSQDEHPEGDSILMSPSQVALLSSSLPKLMDEQKKRWNETYGEEE